jgi:hypothetical protein
MKYISLSMIFCFLSFSISAQVVGIDGKGERMRMKNNKIAYENSIGDSILSILNNGLTLHQYGVGLQTGTAAKYLAVESDGDVIEVDAAAGMDAVVANRSYVDNTAALIDLSSGQVYYNTTSNAFVVLP